MTPGPVLANDLNFFLPATQQVNRFFMINLSTVRAERERKGKCSTNSTHSAHELIIDFGRSFGLFL